MDRSAPDSAAVQGIQAARLWARLTGGLGRSLEGEEEEDWEDLDEESLGSSEGIGGGIDSPMTEEEDSAKAAEERKNRIKKGQACLLYTSPSPRD